MPRQISEAYHHGKDWLTSTAGAPLRAAYDFVFPPLEYEDTDSASNSMDWRASNIRRSGMSSAASTSAAGGFQDEELDHLDVWDSFSESPWSFVTSRYTVALIIVAIVNNRIQNICRPRGGASNRLSQLQRIAVRLPSLVLLARSVLIFTTVVADAFLSESHPINTVLRTCTTTSWRNAWLANTPMSGWALKRFGASSRDALLRARDASALWAGFTATCVTIISDSVVRNLDADREEPPAFNLVGFAFLLHFHSFSPDAPANEHVYLCILLQLLQIFCIAISRCRRPVYAPRLVISGVFGVASLLHYAFAAKTGRYPFLEALSRTPEIALVLIVALTVALHALTMLLLEGKIQTHRLLFSRSNLPSMDEDWSLALFKLGTACMESTRLTGLEREAEPLVAWEAPYIELSQSGRIELVDPLLLRSSAAHRHHDRSAALDAGSEGGFSREVKEVRIEPSAHSGSSTFGHAGLARMRASVRFAVVTLLVLRNLAELAFRKVFRILGLPDPSTPQWVFKALRLVRLVWHGRNGEARRRERQAAESQRQRDRAEQQRQRYGQQSQPASSSAASVRSLLGFSRLYRTEAAALPPAADQDEQLSAQSQRVDELPDRLLGRHRDSATQAAQDEVDSDDGDDDFDVLVAERENDEDEDADADADSVEELPLEPDEVSGLLEELGSFAEDEGEGSEDSPLSSALTLRSGTEAFNRLLLAHLTRPRSQAPLTRSGYTSLLRLSSDSSAAAAQADLNLAQSLMDRRASSSTPARGAGDEARRLCVVCCTEERNVICWPCRCLCLCMDCREHLASRPPARRSLVNNDGDPGTRARDEAAHLCPTCRTPVQAFSRLYIP